MALFYVTADNELRAVNNDGTNDKAITQAGHTMQVSSTSDDDNIQVWILSSDPDTDPAIGGDLLKVSVLDTTSTPVFKDFIKPGAKKFGAKSIAAGKANCYFVEEDGSVHQVDKDGNHKQVFPANTALNISNGDNGLLVMLSCDINFEKGGNLIKWFYDAETPKLLGDKDAVGSQCVSQMGNISYIKPDGGFCSFDPDRAPGGDFAVDGNPVRLITNTEQYLAITDEVHEDGGNLIQNISQPGPTTIKTIKGAIYAEGMSLNYDLFG